MFSVTPALHDHLRTTLRRIALRVRRGVPPTLRELASELDLTPTGVYARLERLRTAGLVTWENRSARSLRPTPAGWDALGEPVTERDAEREDCVAYLTDLEGRYAQAGEEGAADALAAAAASIGQNQHRRRTA